MAGSVLGAYLAEPASHIPGLSRISLFIKYPYALPGIAVMVITIAIAGAVITWVPEVSRLSLSFK
jgi:hypothetical protein